MAQLNWREVTAPDFSTSLEGIRMFSGLLDKAFGGARETLNDMDQSISARVNKDVLAQLVGIQDPNNAGDAVQAILAGTDTRRLSGETLGAMMERPGQVVTQANNKLGFDKTKYAWDRELKRNEILDAASPEIRAWQTALRTNDPKQIAAAESALSAKVGGLSGNDLINFLGDASGMERDSLGNMSARQSYNQSGTRFAWDKEDRAFGQSMEGMMGRIAAGAITKEDARLAMDSDFRAGRINDRQYYQGLKMLDGMGFQDLGSYGGAPGGSYSGDSYGAPGSYDNYVVTLESGGNPNAANSASSATGLHQFTDKTWLNTVRQANPAWAQGMSREQILAQRSNPQRSAEMEGVLRQSNAKALQDNGLPVTNANLYATHHFGAGAGVEFARAPNNTPIESILSPAQIAANPYLKGKTKGQVIANWDSRTGGSSMASALIGNAANAGQQTQTAAASMEQNAGNSLPQRFFEVANSTETPRQVAVRLAKDNPAVNVDWMEQKIIELQNGVSQGPGNRKKVNAAMVGIAIMDNLGGQAAQGGILGSWMPDMFDRNAVGSDLVVNTDAASAALQDYSTGKMDDTIMANTYRAGASQNTQAAQANLTAANNRLAAKQEAMRRRGITDPNLLAREKQDVAIAEAQLAEAQRLENAPGNRLQGQDPPVQWPKFAPLPAKGNAPAPQKTQPKGGANYIPGWGPAPAPPSQVQWPDKPQKRKYDYTRR